MKDDLKKLKKNIKIDPFEIEEENFESQDESFNENKVFLTSEGLEKLKEELIYLKTDGRQKLAERLKEAISYGDLSENAEYEEAKNEQAFVEGRILELESKIKNAQIIQVQHTDKIHVGSKVDIKNMETGEIETMSIVGSTESDPFDGKISNESPLGKALIGFSKGDEIKHKAPGGVFVYEVLKIH